MSWFRRRKRNAAPTAQEMLAQAHADAAARAASSGLDASGDFAMSVEDVFTITGRGVVATGRVRSGSIQVGATVAVHRNGQQIATAELRAVEQFRKTAQHATAGENVGLLFRTLAAGQLSSGDVLTIAISRGPVER
jgi:translation elongation factor EF-Tu-like GTPase